MKISIAAKRFALLLFMVLLNGCAPDSLQIPAAFLALSTKTPTPMNTRIPTHTPVPTYTHTPTFTPVPTNTPIPPTPTVRPPEEAFKYLDGVQVVYVDKFKNPSADGWVLDAGKIGDDGMEVSDNNWNGPFRVRYFAENQGIIIDFSFSNSSIVEMFMNNGEFRTGTYKRFGFYVDYGSPRINIWSGPYFLGGAYISGNLRLKPETMYTAMMVLLPDGGFFCTIWDPQEPAKSLHYQVKKGEKWAELSWLFKLGVKRGTLVVNNYREITFDSFKSP